MFFLKKPSLASLVITLGFKSLKLWPLVLSFKSTLTIFILGFINRNYRVLMFVCVTVSVCVCACVHDYSQDNGSIHLKLEYTVVHVYENSLDVFDIGHCPIKVKVTA